LKKRGQGRFANVKGQTLGPHALKHAMYKS